MLRLLNPPVGHVLPRGKSIVALKQAQQVELRRIPDVRQHIQVQLLVEVLVNIVFGTNHRLQLVGIGIAQFSDPDDFAMVKRHNTKIRNAQRFAYLRKKPSSTLPFSRSK